MADATTEDAAWENLIDAAKGYDEVLGSSLSDETVDVVKDAVTNTVEKIHGVLTDKDLNRIYWTVVVANVACVVGWETGKYVNKRLRSWRQKREHEKFLERQFEARRRQDFEDGGEAVEAEDKS